MRLLQAFAQARKSVAVGLFQPQLDARLLERRGQCCQLDLERGRAEQIDHLAKLFEMHRTHRVYPGSAGIKFRLLLLDTRSHVLDHRAVLAPQATQFHHLLGQIAPPDAHGTPCFGTQLADPGGNRRAQDFLALAHYALPKHPLKRGQLAGLKQGLVTRNLGNQAFLRRNRNDL